MTMRERYGGLMKDEKFIVYNSTFLEGLNAGHMLGITYCDQCLARPNDQSVVIGVGLPERLDSVPPLDVVRYGADEVYRTHRIDLDRRIARIKADMGVAMEGGTGDDEAREAKRLNIVPSYWETLYMLGMFARGELPDDAKTLKALANEMRYREIPFDKLYVYPKHPHKIFPWKYDNAFQGYMEPPKELIQTEYIYTGNVRDGRPSMRILAKGPMERNIHVTKVTGHNLPVAALASRGIKLPPISELERIPLATRKDLDMIHRRLFANTFDVAYLPFGMIGRDSEALIDEALESAWGRSGGEAVVAIPTQPVEKDMPTAFRSWDDMGIQAEGGLPFSRMVDAKRFIASRFSRGRGPGLGQIHLTFYEVGKNGVVSSDSMIKNLGYLPKTRIEHYIDGSPHNAADESEIIKIDPTGDGVFDFTQGMSPWDRASAGRRH